jgi:hypothetical protein
MALVHATFRVSGRIHDVNVGMKILDLASKLGAAKLGHDDVGEENVDGAGWLAPGRWFFGEKFSGKRGDVSVDRGGRRLHREGASW